MAVFFYGILSQVVKLPRGIAGFVHNLCCFLTELRHSFTNIGILYTDVKYSFTSCETLPQLCKKTAQTFYGFPQTCMELSRLMRPLCAKELSEKYKILTINRKEPL